MKKKQKQKYNNENKDNMSEPLVPGQKKTKTIQGLLLSLRLSNVVFPVSIKWFYFDAVRSNIKIKKKRKIKLLTPLPCWVEELQR